MQGPAAAASTGTAALHRATTQTVCSGLDEAVSVADLTQRDARITASESDNIVQQQCQSWFSHSAVFACVVSRQAFWTFAGHQASSLLPENTNGQTI